MDETTGLGALFITSFLASTLLPGGSEAALLFASINDHSTPFNLWWVATLGNTLGGMTNWILGFWLTKKLTVEVLAKTSHQKALTRIQRFGAPALLFSWLPFIGDPLCLIAGWSRIHWFPSILFIAIGKGLRYGAIILTMGG